MNNSLWDFNRDYVFDGILHVHYRQLIIRNRNKRIAFICKQVFIKIEK